MSRQRVGVLALQGACPPHHAAFDKLGVASHEVRRKQDLVDLTHLVIPGGESTTIHHLLELFDLRQEIIDRYNQGELALFGTCAGAILLGRGDGTRPPRFGLLDAEVERNAYGRQVDSFQRPVHLEGLGVDIQGVFIRAPKIRQVGPAARVLASDGDDPILVQGPGLLAATFHPELSESSVVHEYFLRPALWQDQTARAC